MSLAKIMKDIILPANQETFYMVFFSTIFAILMGAPIGIILFVTGRGSIAENRKLNLVLEAIVNILRSIPFIILMIVLLSLAQAIVGTQIGPKAAVVYLSISAAPFFARMLESSLKEVDYGTVEAAKAMGSNNWQIVFKVLIPEAMPQIIDNITMTIINIISYSAMAGTIGAGGLGSVAVRYGYYRREDRILFISVIIIVLIVQLVQFVGTRLANFINKK